MRYKLTKSDKSKEMHLRELKKLQKEANKIVLLENLSLSDLVDSCNLVFNTSSKELPHIEYRDHKKDRIRPVKDYLSIETGICSSGYTEHEKKRHYVIHFERKANIKRYRYREYNEHQGNIINIYCLADNIKDCIIEFKEKYREVQ